MAFADAAGEQFLQHGDGFGRDWTKRGDAVDDFGLLPGGQGVEHGGSDFGVELHQQDGDGLRMFVLHQWQQRRGIEPAGQFYGVRSAGIGGDALHQVAGFHFAQGRRHQRADLANAIMHDQALPFGAIDKAGDGVGDDGW